MTNANQAKEMKNFYENNIKNAVATALNADEKNIVVNWNFDSTSVIVDASGSDFVAIYNFVAANDNITVSIECYSILTGSLGNNKYVNGIQSKYGQIDFNTFAAIKTAIEKELNEPYVSCEHECEETCDCERTCADDVNSVEEE